MNRAWAVPLVACFLVSLAGYYGFQVYRVYAARPLGPSIPRFTPLALPATWTPTPGTPISSIGAVTLAPTIPIPSTNTTAPICGGSGVMTLLAVGADSRADNYRYGLADVIRVVRVDFSSRKVAVREFPRDLWVEIPYVSDNINGQDHEKLNQAYLYGSPGGRAPRCAAVARAAGRTSSGLLVQGVRCTGLSASAR